MEKLASILVVVDPRQEMYRTLGKALLLARAFGARLELFHCDMSSTGELKRAITHSVEEAWRAPAGVAVTMEELERARAASLEDRLEYLEALRTSLAAEDVPITLDVACHSALHESVLRKVREAAPGLVIKAASGRHPVRRISFDRNDWQLAQHCPAPLLLTQARQWAQAPRFAAAVDVSAEKDAALARRILHAAGFLAAGCRATLDVLYSDLCENDVARRTEHFGRFETLAAEHRVSRDRLCLLKGMPRETLPAFAAEQDYDVIALGAVSRRHALAALAGTLTSTLVDALECDFLLVKPAGFTA